MGRSKWSPQSNRSNFKELSKNREKAKNKKNKRNELEHKDYAYFSKHGTFRSGDNYRSLKEEALYRYFAYV